ncbi:unnamed protein product [Lymnaea stagnalis]|uniref:G-protein coupled receptors family 1 profile domain-containing protein n=1 Tax=Lymnaea stagnalis TaxID=6523 RepID=A0AAV2I582_LYMST
MANSQSNNDNNYYTEPESVRPSKDGSLKFSPIEIPVILFTVWVLFSNLTLILAILRSEHRRKISFNLHVCNLCVVGLLLGGLVLPLLMEFRLRDVWFHDENLCRVWLMADMMVSTVSILTIGVMIFDRFVLFSCPGSAEGGCKFVVSAILIILPWAGGASIVLPVYLFGETGSGVVEGYCFLHLEPVYSIASELAGYAVPGLAALGLLVATTLTFCVRREELREMDYSEEREHKGWQVLMLWIMSLAVLGLWCPFAVLHVLIFFAPGTPSFYSWLTFAIWSGYANAGLNPILWMIMPKLRQSVKALCCCCYKHRYDDDEDDVSVFEEDDETNAAMIEFHPKNYN